MKIDKYIREHRQLAREVKKRQLPKQRRQMQAFLEHTKECESCAMKWAQSRGELPGVQVQMAPPEFMQALFSSLIGGQEEETDTPPPAALH